MSALEFVSSLLHRGVGRVKTLSDELPDLPDAVHALDRAVRPEMAYDPPRLVESAAAWALQILYRSCQFLAYREADEDTVRRTLSETCPDPPSPPVCYSVDLAMRYLPELLSLTRGIAPGDPLVRSLLALARGWPLSSVGVVDMSDPDVSAFIDHPSLRQLYVDRILERRDLSRLKHPVVRDAVSAAIGSFPELAPFLASPANKSEGVAQSNAT